MEEETEIEKIEESVEEETEIEKIVEREIEIKEPEEIEKIEEPTLEIVEGEIEKTGLYETFNFERKYLKYKYFIRRQMMINYYKYCLNLKKINTGRKICLGRTLNDPTITRSGVFPLNNFRIKKQQPVYTNRNYKINMFGF